MSIVTERAALFGQGLDIIPRERWGARQRYTSSRPVERGRWLFLHVAVIRPSGDEAADMRAIEAIGEARFGIGCSYNAAAFRSGRLYEAQPLGRRGAHTVNDKPNPGFPAGSLNGTVRALVLPQDVEHAVTDAQVDAAARWGAALCRAGLADRGARWFGHRDVTAKSCPGPIAYARLGELNRLTRHYEAHGLTEDPDEMTPEQEAKLDDLAKAVALLVNRLGTTSHQDNIPLGKRSVVERRVSLTYKAIGDIVARVAALQSAIGQLGAGGDIDYGKVEAAVERGVRDVFGGLNE